MPIIVLVVLFTWALWVRRTLRDRKPTLRTKSGESRQEASLILLGTYRVYSWTLAAAVGAVMVRGILGEYAPWWLPPAGAACGILMLILARAVYWRLGYSEGRLILVLGHLSGLFALGECLYVLSHEVHHVTRAGSDVAEG